MDNLIGGIVGLVFGLCVLVAIYGVINGAISLGNRLLHGARRIDYLILVTNLATIQKHAPQAITRPATGGMDIDGIKCITLLFAHAHDIVNESRLRRMATQRKLLIALLTDHAPQSGEEAAAAAMQLLRGKLPRKLPRRTNVYSTASKVTSGDERAYLVIVGNLPDPPIVLVPSFD